MNTNIGKYILIVESGATKANWVLLSGPDCIFNEQSPGLNPYFLTDDEMKDQFRFIKSKLPESPHFIYFYGTGCGAEDQKDRVSKILGIVFNPVTPPVVDTDIIAAARSIGKRKNGLVGILGTGSNACLVKNGHIVAMAGGFGFILGDEGSGASLGLTLLRCWLNQEMPAEIQSLVKEELHLKKEEIFQAVYKNPFPSRYLAQFAPFFFKHKEHWWIKEVVKQQFNLFVKRYFLGLIKENQDLKVYFIGSVAYFFETIIAEVLLENKLNLGGIVKDPMAGLIQFHLKD
jgi:N-acetylglucosamine kinase-like BadF-type ATPase